ncbi:MAG: hypothetical protein ABI779_18465 [Acidobacteriota bacterium]
MSDPTFTDTGQQLYYLDGAGSQSGLPRYNVVFLPRPGSGLSSPLTLAQTWVVPGGVYLFLNAPVSDIPAFQSAVWQFLSAPGNAAVRFLWLDDPNAPLSAWSPATLTDAGGVVGALNSFFFRNYRLNVGGSCTIALNSTRDGVQIVQVAGSQSITFSSGIGSAIPATGTTLLLPFSGASLGCLAFAMTLAQNGSTDGTSDVDRMDVGLRYFYDDAGNPGFLVSLRYRVFSTAAQSINLGASLDPINSTVVSRTFLGMAPGGAAQSLATCFTSWVGLPASMSASSSGSPALVFATNASTTSDDPADPFYLVPSGSFAWSVPPGPVAGSGPAGRLMLGSSAIEYGGASSASGNTITFIPGRNAYAPAFSSALNPPAGGGGAALRSGATTSWIYLTAAAGQSISYYTQPDRSALYHVEGTPSDPKATFLDFMEIVSRVLPVPPGGTTYAFPAVPYGNLAGLSSASTYATFESRVLGPARQQAMATIPAGSVGASGTGSGVGTTRHGYLARFDPTFTTWDTLELAQSDVGLNQLTIAGPAGGAITGALRDDLLASEQFLVFAGAKFAQNASLPEALLTIEGFGFDLAPANWSQHDTIMLMKYAGGSAYDLAADLSAWTDTRTFNDGTITQQHLLKIFQDADRRALTNPDFATFVEVIHDPLWNGILAMNVVVPPTSFPPELAGLIAGIDMSMFSAHHLGVNLSPVVLAGSPLALAMKDSSLFGLIDYDVSATPFQPDGNVYRYRVESLRVLFENSHVQRFASSVQVMMNMLFGESATLIPPSGSTAPLNTITLRGTYQETHGVRSYAFSTDEDNVFAMVSTVLAQVEITRGQFLTLTTAADYAAGKDVLTRFAFWGSLRFRALPDFDLFSYGLEANGDRGQLSFTNLGLDMSFPQAAPQQQEFFFNAQQLAVNLATSRPRVNSLVRRFPVAFDSFLQAEGGSSPESLGYHGIITPVPESRLTYPWYALVFELKLGSLGALAGKAGFVAQLMAAWSPNPNGISMFAGILIPGTGATGKLFSLESILSLSIDSFQFVTAQAPAGGLSYTLALTNIRLNFMGKQLPASAYIDFILFGDPGGSGDTLGWYTSYIAADDPAPKKKREALLVPVETSDRLKSEIAR